MRVGNQRPGMSSRDDTDEELAALLADLERTLTELRSAVDEDVRRRRRPPTPGEILRFTEEYTIPTLIALLEATVQSLELLRAVLRLAGLRPTDDRLRERLQAPDAPDAATLRDAITELRTALSGANPPEESAAESVLSDARALTDEIDDRLADETESERTSAPAEGVAIDVQEEDETVDVDAELESIKESLADDDNEE